MTGIRRAPQSETSTDATAELELQRVSDLKARARAESTTRHHRAHWQPFKRWCEANGLDPMAIDDRTVCAYLYGLLEEGGSFSRIRNYHGAISWGRREAGTDDPTDSDLVRRFMSAAQRFLGNTPDPDRQSVAFTVEQVRAIAEAPAVAGSGHSDIRVARDRAIAAISRSTGLPAVQIVGAHGFGARCSVRELRSLVGALVARDGSAAIARIVAPGTTAVFNGDSVELIAVERRNGRRHPSSVTLARTDSRFCPVRLVGELAAATAGGELFCDAGDPAQPRDGHPAYQRVLAHLTKHCRDLGMKTPADLQTVHQERFDEVLDRICAEGGAAPVRDADGWRLAMLPIRKGNHGAARPARTVVVSATGGEWCPVAAIDRYLEVLDANNIHTESMALLFGVATAHGEKRVVDPANGRELVDLRTSVHNQMRFAAQRAGLELDDVEQLSTVADDAFARFWRHIDRRYRLMLRTRTMLLCMVATGARHSSIENCAVDDIERRHDGFLLLFRREKHDQQRKGRRVPVLHSPNGCSSTCPACALGEWLDEMGLETGPLFPSLDSAGKPKARAVGSVDSATQLKAAAAAVGIEGRVGTHSLKRTHITTRAQAGDSVEQIAADVGTSPEVIATYYVKPANLFDGALPLDPSEQPT